MVVAVDREGVVHLSSSSLCCTELDDVSSVRRDEAFWFAARDFRLLELSAEDVDCSAVLLVLPVSSLAVRPGLFAQFERRFVVRM